MIKINKVGRIVLENLRLCCFIVFCLIFIYRFGEFFMKVWLKLIVNCFDTLIARYLWDKFLNEN